MRSMKTNEVKPERENQNVKPIRVTYQLDCSSSPILVEKSREVLVYRLQYIETKINKKYFKKSFHVAPI